ncbi:transmembrane channel-like protein 3 isoform X2 [Trichoplusia ni]|uniref:Transmembrane channel-like protein 3 isoform X2 n=1 Tax=Trichoplusia ni TaxID=7111 RepID=A0A7E5VAU0_TRINI|nr:transmembrane channel-like protein 3 isoform X2 [Trichoplusia ni]
MFKLQDSAKMDEDIEEVETRPASSRRSVTLRNNAARQVAVNFMPSRQLPYNTLRLRRNNSEHNALLEEVAADDADAPDNAEKQADIIVREMEQHKRLMEDDPEAEELRREALRDLPQGLTMKRNVRAKLSASVSLRSKGRPISLWKRMKYRAGFAWKRIRDQLREVIFSFEFWYEPIRRIEGHFGSAVGSYFYFLRWLFALDLFLTILVVAFVVIPQILHDDEKKETVQMTALDFITGMGGLTDSLLFYGHYHDGDISTNSLLNYNMPFAYFFTMVCLYLMFFGVLCYRTAYSYRLNFIETSGGLSHVFANKVFCGWDFGVVTQEAARLNANSLYNEFKELLSEQSRKNISISWVRKLGQYVTNVLVSVFVVALIVGSEWGLWLLLGWDSPLRHFQLFVSAVLTAVLTICPLIFHVVVKLEFYKPRTSLYVSLARTWLLVAGTLLLLLVYWAREHAQQCWETSFGQEAYRLVLLDTAVSLFVLPLFEFSRGLIYQWGRSESAPEFNIAYNSLTLIYNQTVLWFGMMFSPLLVVAVTLKFLLLFYIKKECALRACQPARKVWRAAQTQTVLYMFVTLSLFTTLFGLGSLFFRTSSHACGPFRGYAYVYSVVSEGVLQLQQRPAARSVLLFIIRPGVIGFLMLFLCVAVYYLRARSRAQRDMVAILRRMLRLQARDKDFLLTAIANVANGEWLYSPKPDDEGPDSHTFKYLQEVRKPSNSGFHFDASRLSHSLIEGRPRSFVKENRSSNYDRKPDDGDTDSSFSWQGSNNYLNRSE